MLRFVLLGCTGNSAQQSEPAHLITCDPFLEMSTSILLEFFFFVLVGWGFFWRCFLFPCFRCWRAYTAYHSIHNYIFLSLTSLKPKAFFFFFFAKYLLMWQNQVRQKPRKALKDTFVKAQQDYIPQKRSQSVLALSKKHLAGPTEKVSRCRVFSQPVCSCRATQQTLMSWQKPSRKDSCCL